MCCTLESTHSRKELFFRTGFPAKLMCFRGRPRITLARKNGGERGKLADKFTPWSITVAPTLIDFARKSGIMCYWQCSYISKSIPIVGFHITSLKFRLKN